MNSLLLQIARLSPKFLLSATTLLAFSLTACAEEKVGFNLNNEVRNKTGFELNLIGNKPHSTSHFTQGLFFFNDNLYESIGQYGQSALLKYNRDISGISVKRNLEDQYFAEGATELDSVIYQLTWQAGTAFAYKGPMLSASTGFNYEGQGWGLTSDEQSLWMSDGSDTLQVLNHSGQVQTTLAVTYRERPLDRLNELEWINGWLLANRWYDSHIYVINPVTGVAVNAFDLSELSRPELSRSMDNVLNGIAWNPETETLWVTGKNWSNFYLFKIQLPPP